MDPRSSSPDLPPAHDKRLFTPGPLTTSRTVKQAMLRDLGSRDETFLAAVREVRERLLAAYGLSQAAGYEAIPLQGSGTYAVEAALSSIVPRTGGKLLALVNGAYGERIVRMAAVHGIPCEVLRTGEDTPVDAGAVAAALARDPKLTHVSLVHVETTSGVLNPLRAVGEVVRAAKRCLFVDAMSSFGALPLEFEAGAIDYLASSSNKCLEGIPGLGFVIARRAALERIEGQARALVLDIHAQWRGLEKDGQFRFTPPTHVLLALRQALRELELEGGVAARGARYRANHEHLRAGMEALGFRSYVPARHSGPIISTFLYPQHPRFDFQDFYRRLSARGFLIYPGKLTQAECFRLGNIGQLFAADMEALLAAVPLVLREMGVELGRSQA
jgi:2-aminoethylphosphonate-pyruvate transaminase